MTRLERIPRAADAQPARHLPTRSDKPAGV
ncbi:hypothetical protein SAMN05192568_102376 [Methylobacterium pseudosasicola]|uniref:Uncharacterized protein n=1 Tax=Methylobacterium pseudosasicola TaxID=582667 RepID=A0A1I4P6B8_9HYPH|nr:hypothetical protein SAMN05192568_102376 [Methylobacterium pseudosasicola]